MRKCAKSWESVLKVEKVCWKLRKYAKCWDMLNVEVYLMLRYAKCWAMLNVEKVWESVLKVEKVWKSVLKAEKVWESVLKFEKVC